MSSGSESNIEGTSGMFRWTSAVSSVVYAQDAIWLPSPNWTNSEIIQPFPLQICKLSYTSSSNWERKPETDMPRPDSHLHHDLCYVFGSVGNCWVKRESAPRPWVHCNKFSSLENSLLLCPESCWSSSLALLRIKFQLHGYHFPVRSRMPKAAMLLGAGGLCRRSGQKRHISGNSQTAWNNYFEIFRKCEIYGLWKKSWLVGFVSPGF